MKRRGIKLAAAALALSLLCTFPAAAAPSGPSVSGPAFTEVLEEPQIQSEGAVVIDGSTGAVLYGKNQNTRYYPASITKLMTALLVLEHCGLDEVVTFSETATTNLESGAVSLGLTAGDQLTVRQCLYALLLKSANEVGNGLAEHVSGSVSAFADLMNQKAASLGCTGTHFTNPHGLNDANHYTTPYDMALIARAAFQNPTLREIDTTLSYQLPATKNAGARTITMGHKMMYPTDSRYYEGIIGGKTGYTSKAGNTLVTGAEKNGVQVIAVVMKSSSTHYQDTKKLLDYGFARLGQTSQGSQTSAARLPEQPDRPGRFGYADVFRQPDGAGPDRFRPAAFRKPDRAFLGFGDRGAAGAGDAAPDLCTALRPAAVFRPAGGMVLRRQRLAVPEGRRTGRGGRVAAAVGGKLLDG